MTIDFFQTNGGIDKRSITGGIYHVELINKDTSQAISLYVGESAWIIERCGIHLYAFNEDPNYFGLYPEDLKRENLVLKFSILKDIHEKKSVLGIGRYKDMELEYIKRKNPLTQLNTSDRQIRDKKVKIKRVQDEMDKLKFK